MLHLTESASGLLLAVPLWISALAILLGLALVASVALAKLPAGRALVARVPLLARIPIAPWLPMAKLRLATAVMALLAGAFLVYTGVHFLRGSTTFERVGLVVNGVGGEEARVAWSQVRRYEVEELALGRGRANYLILYLQDGEWLPIGISGLPAEDALKLQQFARERMGR